MIDAAETAALAFIQRWSGTTASELATAQSFVIDLCSLLGVERPHATPEQDYMFERPVTFSHGDGSNSAGRVDCYKRGHFVLEAKKLRAGAHTRGFDDSLMRARAQGEGYARALPAAEGRPPFVLVVDVGTVIEVYAEFSQSGATYTPFPDPRSHRIKLAELIRPEIRARLHKIWTDPSSLNPALISAQVTREVAALLAQLATSLETAAAPDIVAAYLTRCLFSMFAEDVELLPKGSFLGLLQTHRADPSTLQIMLRSLWADMDTGGFSVALAKKLLRFNGKLFKNSTSDGYSLLLTTAQIDLLILAARTNWREVEPAIFGTLLERALDPIERHSMGAHFTPRAYVERLVLPTVIEPLRSEWADVQAAALVLAHEAALLDGKPHTAKMQEARAEVKKFHHRLCTVVVLDPACGSANFLYVTLEHLKRLEGEVLNQLEALGTAGAGFQDSLGFEGETVTLQQLRGIELNERAAALAELVLWIGFLQWHIRTQGNAAVAEPVVHDYGNIECRDAVLAWDDQAPAYGAEGQLLTRWDGLSFKVHPVTGAQVPDDAAQVVQWKYLNARKAVWPDADFLVGNPPFIGASTMRAALGDGYVEALRQVWADVPESADFVMYWWAHAAGLVATGQALRFGLITTNSLRQTFNRRVVQAALEGVGSSVGLPGGLARGSSDGLSGGLAGGLRGGLAGSGARTAAALRVPNAHKSDGGSPYPVARGVSLVFAIADHPWVDSANGAAVRIAMTVGARNGDAANTKPPASNGAAELGSDPDSGQSPDRSTKPRTKSGSDPNFAGRSDGASDATPPARGGAANLGSDPDSGQSPDRSAKSRTKSGSDPNFAGRSDGAANTTPPAHDGAANLGSDPDSGQSPDRSTKPRTKSGSDPNFAGRSDGASNATPPARDAAANLGSDPDSGQWPDRSTKPRTKSGSDPIFAGRSDMTGRLLTVTSEQTGEFGEVGVTLTEKVGVIHADLSVGANVASAVPLQANANMSSPGVKLHGAGFIVSPEEARALGQGSLPGLERVIREYRNGRDLTDATRGVKVIDAFGMCADQLRSQYPAVYQWLMERVKPERDQNNRATYRDNWWIFGEPRKDLRPALHGLPRYIATVETAKHRTFQFLDASILPDNKLIAIALADAFHLGVLSSRAHGSYALAAGSWLGVGNDPVYVKSRCFETFPFPDQDTGLTPELRARIANLAEQIDAHRKKVLAQSGAVGVKLTLTALYNVLEALKENRPLSAKEKLIHTHGLVGVLKELHDELDAAVLQAYGLTAHANTDDILSHLVALNQQRALEEAQGTVRWLRPEFQNPTQPTNESLSTARLYPQTPQPQQASLMLESTKFGSAPAPEGLTSATQFTEPPLASVVTWPATLPEQVRAVAQVLSGSTTALTLEQIEARFKGKGGWKKGLPTLLATLEALGRAQPTQVADTTVWRA